VKYQVLIEYDPETRAYCATVPGLPVIVDASSEEDALRLAKEGIEFYFEDDSTRRAVPHPQRPAYAKVVTVEVDAGPSR
jgi:predicted RNase H-like HicB family nuclease